jgi:hypothetical protein
MFEKAKESGQVAFAFMRGPSDDRLRQELLELRPNSWRWDLALRGDQPEQHAGEVNEQDSVSRAGARHERVPHRSPSALSTRSNDEPYMKDKNLLWTSDDKRARVVMTPDETPLDKDHPDADLIEAHGVWCLVAEMKCPSSDSWKVVDSVGGYVGRPYDEAVAELIRDLQEAIETLKGSQKTTPALPAKEGGGNAHRGVSRSERDSRSPTTEGEPSSAADTAHA